MKCRTHISILITCIILLSACEHDPALDINSKLFDTPDHFAPMKFPEDNAYTSDRWELGKMLFFDNRLSKDSTLNCGSCHKPELSFSDDVAFSPGVENRPGVRNSPSLANIGYHPYFTREGGVATLEMQVLVPVQEHNEFDFNIVEIEKRLSSDSAYQQKSRKAYNRNLDYYVITRAISNFERSLISASSTYDQFLTDDLTLTGEEIAGMDLFFSSKTNCSSCHSGFNFTNYNFTNNGLYNDYNDEGRKRLTGLDKDDAVFKVPSLRNVELTAPYMHDGSLPSLEAVINHYNSGGMSHANKHELIKPLHLTQKEQEQLIAFLKTLTDHKFINNPIFKP